MVSGTDLFLGLFNNLAIFIVLVAGYSFLHARLQQTATLTRQGVLGLFFGLSAIACMYVKIPAAPGVIVDQRNTIVVLSGAFGGPLSAVVSSVMAAAYRLHLGGSGVLAGSVGVGLAAVAGIVIHQFRDRIDTFLKAIFSALMATFIILPGFLFVGDLQNGYGLMKAMALPYGSAIFLGILLVGVLLGHEEHRHAAVMDRLRAERDWERLKAQMINAVEIAHLGPWEYDVVSDVFTFNDHFYALFGVTVDEVGGYEMSSAEYAKRFIHPEDVYVVSEEIQKAIQTDDPNFRRQLEHRILYANGGIGRLFVRFFIVKDEGGRTVKAYGVNQDVTELKKMEERLQQAQKMESIGNLAGGIAHDFNNILFPIMGMSEMLLDDIPADSPEYGNVQEIFKASQRGSDLVKQILAFSRQSEQKKIPLRIQSIIKEIIKLSRSTIPSNIAIVQEVQSDCGLVMADPSQIHQIAMNLITNAYHSLDQVEEKRITIALSETDLKPGDASARELEPGRYAMMSVSDTGHGIEPEIMDKIFEPYFTTKEQGKGTGLGLAVVFGIVKEHKGDIKVSSKLGRGATFTIYLPLIERTIEPVSVKPMEGDQTGNEHILVVDDEEVIARLEKQMLESLGYRVSMRVNSIEALAAFKANPAAFDLVLSDMSMPNMTGAQLAKKIIAIRPDIPIIICTGFSEQLSEEKAAPLGIKGLLMKPVIKSDMARMVRNVLTRPNEATVGLEEES